MQELVGPPPCQPGACDAGPGAESEGAEPEGAESEGAEPEGAELEGAEPEGAEPEGAESEGAELEGAELEGAELEGAEPEGAELEGAEEEGAGPADPPPDGTPEAPWIIPVAVDGSCFTDRRDTRQATSDRFDRYPPDANDESGPEYVYRFTLPERLRVKAWIPDPEPDGTDIDLHLLSALEPLTLISRAHHAVEAVLDPGTYHLILDTFAQNGQPLAGAYWLHVQFERPAAGTPDDPILPAGSLDQPWPLPFVYTDARSTTEAVSDVLDRYPPSPADESGPEFVYAFRIDRPARFSAALRSPEPDGVDVDLHLLTSLTPPALLQRDNAELFLALPPGVYYLVADTYVANGAPLVGRYRLTLSASEEPTPEAGYFNHYVLAAVDYLAANYRLLGYDSQALTHDLPYGRYGLIRRTGDGHTMCVAAVLEVILTALQLYVRDTGDETVYDFLPKRSWERLGAQDIRGHIWVNHDLEASGTADALRNFGMGENIPFERLRPGAFLNLNRTNGTGHAVVFLAFIDRNGVESAVHHPQVVGFKYFSSQGGYAVGEGGLDYRYAIFDDFERTEMPYRRDVGVIYSEDQLYLNTGMLWSPDRWQAVRTKPQSAADDEPDVSEFDPVYFDGLGGEE